MNPFVLFLVVQFVHFEYGHAQSAGSSFAGGPGEQTAPSPPPMTAQQIQALARARRLQGIIDSGNQKIQGLQNTRDAINSSIAEIGGMLQQTFNGQNSALIDQDSQNISNDQQPQDQIGVSPAHGYTVETAWPQPAVQITPNNPQEVQSYTYNNQQATTYQAPPPANPIYAQFANALDDQTTLPQISPGDQAKLQLDSDEAKFIIQSQQLLANQVKNQDDSLDPEPGFLMDIEQSVQNRINSVQGYVNGVAGTLNDQQQKAKAYLEKINEGIGFYGLEQFPTNYNESGSQNQ